MIEINLLPDVKRELLKAQRARATVISASIITSIIAVGLVVVLVLYIYGVQTARGYLLDQDITRESDKLSKVEDLSKILTIQNQLTKISEHNGQKNIDSRLFNVLSAVIPPSPNEVFISRVVVDSSLKSVRLEGHTRSYDAMETFNKTLSSAVIEYTQNGEKSTDQKLASDISVSETSYGQDADGARVLRFTLTFTYNENLFSALVSDLTVKLSINGNVTDSYLGIPKSIFAEKATDIEQ